ncbi:MAG: DinB family protein [Bacteroidota bacterium]
MGKLNVLWILCFGTLVYAQKNEDTLLRKLLIDQLNYSYSAQNWFVPVRPALEGLSAEQAIRKDSVENHSIGALVSHIAYWNEIYLRVLAGEDFSDLDIDNEETFKVLTDREWGVIVKKLDSVQTEMERMVKNISDSELSERASDLLSLTSHSAYHVGQIVYLRKRNGWWSKSKK